MPNIGKFMPGKSGNPSTMFKAGNGHRWQKGQSGNPDGVARRRLEFEQAFYAALLDQGTAEEAASLLWDAARDREPWAIQALLQRLAPEAKKINVTHGLQEEEIDYEQLTDDEISVVVAIAERTKVKPASIEGGASPPQL